MRQVMLAVILGALLVSSLRAEEVVHGTSTDFAAGTWTNVEDIGSGSNPQVRMEYNLPYGFGSGKDGALSVTSNQTYVETFVPVGFCRLNSSSGSTVNVTDVRGGWRIQNGDIVLLHQTRGSSAGNWELRKVVSGAPLSSGATGTFTLDGTLSYSYSTSGNNAAQVIRVLEFSQVTVNSGMTLTAQPWDGVYGGIIPFLCNGTADINGTISAAGQGFRGGTPSRTGSPDGHAGSRPGEGHLSYTTSYTNARQGNGGGGIKNGDGGTGAGGGHVSTGGGGAGSGGAQGGNTSGNAALTSMTFGGGGGASRSNKHGCNGSRGGGIVFIFAREINLPGIISANSGGNIANGEVSGGAGAGGAVMVKAHSRNWSGNRITATSYTPSGGSWTQGGAGSAGRVRLETGTGTANGTSNPGASTAAFTFKTSGSYLSPPIETPLTTQFGNMSWSYSGGTSVQIRTRSAATEAGLASAAWSDYLTTSGQAIQSAANPWFQYEAAFTGTTTSAPVLTSVSFTYATNNRPTNPASPSPADAAYVNTPNMTLSWAASTDLDDDPITYSITIADNAALTNPTVDEADCGATPQYSTTLADGQYYWRVRAWDGKDYNENSAIWTFTLDKEAPDTLTIDGMRCDFRTEAIIRLYGTGEDDTTLTFFDRTNAQIAGTTEWDGSGNFTFAPSSALAPGSTVYAVSTDLAQNSTYSDVYVLTFEAMRNVFRDTQVYYGSAPGSSLRLERSTEYRFKIAAGGGTPVTVSAYLRKNAAYDGTAPRITLSGQGISGGGTTASLSVGPDAWQQLTVSGTPNAAGVLTLTVETFGQADAAAVYIDEIAVAQ